MHDFDADGVTSAVIWQRTFERLGFSNLGGVIADRFRDAWSESNRGRAAAARPDKLFVLDLGSRGETIVDGVATCLIDHHHPDGVPPGAMLISGYDRSPIPNTSLLTFEVCSNAARRASSFDPERAVRILLEHDSPSAILQSDGEDLRALEAARDEVNEEMAKGKMSAPKFAGNVALIRVRSRCQIHPLIAQIWRSRLPSKDVVIVSNDGYLPGRVNFSARSEGDANALQLLRSVELPAGEGDYAHGHDHASGGSLPEERWNALLKALGF